MTGECAGLTHLVTSYAPSFLEALSRAERGMTSLGKLATVLGAEQDSSHYTYR